MKYSNIKYFCTVNGVGVRTAVFVSGCDMNPHCKGCFNSRAWDFEVGKDFTDETIEKVLKSIEAPYIDGLSILGGDPLALRNCEGVKKLITAFRERFGASKDIWLWSGYLLKNMNELQKDTISQCDYLVDGPFIESLFSDDLKFKGSSNQTVWKNDNGNWIVSEYN